MSLVDDLVELITTPHGALAYHLVTLFAIQLIVGVALGHWQRQRDRAAARLVIMALGLLLARLVMMLLAVVAGVNLVSSALVLPPLERFLQFVTSLLVIWAFLPILRERVHLSTFLLLSGVVLAAVAYAASASLWSEVETAGTSYAMAWQGRLWELSTAAVIGLALLIGLAWRGADWGWMACLLALWLTGHILQLIAPIRDVHSAPWVRLANLAALPLLAALVYRRALAMANVPATSKQGVSSSAIDLLTAVRSIHSEGDLRAGLELALPTIARAVDADMAAVGLLVPGLVDTLRVVALHPKTNPATERGAVVISLSDYPLLNRVAHSRRPDDTSGDASTVPETGDLYRRLGWESSGPLLVEPLISGREILGLVWVGNPESEREWSSREAQILEGAALVLACAIAGEGNGE